MRIACRFLFIWVLLGSAIYVNATTLEEGNAYLKNGQLNEAIQKYESIVNEGYISHQLFYNLGTAYSKKGNISYAILNFELALRLKPLHVLTKKQLIQLNLQLRDKPAIYEDTGLLSFFIKLQFSMSIDAWAFLSIFFMILVPIVIFISYKFRHIKRRQFVFLSSIFWVLLSLFSLIMARNSYHTKYKNLQAIVHFESIKVLEQTNTNASILFNLHTGTKVDILDSAKNMYYVKYAEKEGWINKKEVAKIEL